MTAIYFVHTGLPQQTDNISSLSVLVFISQGNIWWGGERSLPCISQSLYHVKKSVLKHTLRQRFTDEAPLPKNRNNIDGAGSFRKSLYLPNWSTNLRHSTLHTAVYSNIILSHRNLF